jgi:hypothetical protein
MIYLTTSSDTLAIETTVRNDCMRVNSALERKQKDARERDRLGDPGLDGRIILRGNFRKWNFGVWTRSSWLRIGMGGGTCECGNEHSGSIKYGEFLE